MNQRLESLLQDQNGRNEDHSLELLSLSLLEVRHSGTKKKKQGTG